MEGGRRRKALDLASGAVVTAIVGARSGFAVIGVGLLAVAATYTLYLLRARTSAAVLGHSTR